MAGARVLVVEDVRHMAHFVKRSLERAGYEVHAVHHGDEVLPAVEAFAPRALVLDLVLPGMSGMDICKALRSDPRHARLAILIVTGHSFEDASAEEIRAAGANCHFTKPVSPVSLRAKLAEFGIHGEDPETQADAGEAHAQATAKTREGKPLRTEIAS